MDRRIFLRSLLALATVHDWYLDIPARGSIA